MSSKNQFEPEGGTESARFVLYSIIENRQMINENQWAVSLVRSGSAEHAFLIIEGIYNAQPIVFRSDLFLNSREGQSSQSAPLVGNVFDRFVTLSESSRGEAFIRVKEIALEELGKLANNATYQSWALGRDEAEKLLTSLEKWGNKTLTYHKAGDHPIFSTSTSTLKHHNCVSWCEAVLKEINPDKFVLGAKWSLIKRPSERVDAAIGDEKNQGQCYVF